MLERYIVNDEEGTLQFQHPSLEDAQAVTLAKRLLPLLPGITNVQAVGDRLEIHYDSSRLSRDKLLHAAELWLLRNPPGKDNT